MLVRVISGVYQQINIDIIRRIVQVCIYTLGGSVSQNTAPAAPSVDHTKTSREAGTVSWL